MPDPESPSSRPVTEATAQFRWTAWSHWQPPTARRTDAAAEFAVKCTREIEAGQALGRLRLMGQLGCHRRFDHRTRQPRRQHGQWVPQIDHLIKARAKKSSVVIVKFPRNRAGDISNSGDFGCKIHAGK